MTSTLQHRSFSIGRVWAITCNTLTELIRQKVFYFLVFFALLLIGSSTFLLQFKFQDQFQMLKDLSLGAMSIFTCMLAILCTANLLPKDLEDRTLYTILAKPVSRFEYLMGKLGGVILLLMVALLLMGAMFAVVLVWRVHVTTNEIVTGSGNTEDVTQQLLDLHKTAYNPNLCAAALVIYMKACLLASMTLFVSTIASSSLFTIVVSMIVYLIGHLQATARDYWQSTHTIVGAGLITKTFLVLVSLVFPDLQIFNLIDEIVVGTPIGAGILLKVLGLGITYVCVYLLAAFFTFSTREL